MPSKDAMFHASRTRYFQGSGRSQSPFSKRIFVMIPPAFMPRGIAFICLCFHLYINNFICLYICTFIRSLVTFCHHISGFCLKVFSSPGGVFIV